MGACANMHKRFMAESYFPLTVVIMARYSLLSEGIAQKLTEFSGELRVKFISVETPDIPKQLIDAAPAVLLLDSEELTNALFPIQKILTWLPNTKILRFDLRSDRVNIFSRKEVKLNGISDLMNVIQNISSENAEWQ